MRIAYVAKMFPRVSETFIANEISELQRRGLDVRIVSLLPTTVKQLWPEIAHLAESTFELPTPADHRGQVLSSQFRHLRRRPARYLRCVAQVSRRLSLRAWKRFFQATLLLDYCETHEIDHIHAAFAHTPASVALWVKRLGDISYSVSTHAKDLYLSAPSSIVRKAEEARFVWTCTEANGRYLRDLGCLAPVHVGYHGIDVSRFTPREKPRDSRFRIVSLCRHVPKKGLPHLVDSLDELRARGRTDFELILAGDGPERAALEDAVRTKGLADYVQFPGTLLSTSVLDLYASADVFVLPCVVLESGDRDGIPNVLVEAIASGVPVVSTTVSGVPELIEDGVSGLLVAPGDSVALADAIESVWDHPDEAAARAERARQVVHERFDVHQNSERLAKTMTSANDSCRALYVSGDLGIPVRGHKGASAHVRQISEQLARRDVALRVLTPAPGPEPPSGNEFDLPIAHVPASEMLAKWLRRYPKGSKRRGVLQETRRLLYNTKMFRALAQQPQPDLVYERYSLCAVAGGLYAKLRRIPWILEVNAPLADEEAEFRGLIFGRLTRSIERWCLRNADHVYVVSHALRRWAMTEGAHPDCVTTLPNGVDRARFHPQNDGMSTREELGFAREDVVFAFSGSLKPWHGGDVLLRAWERTRRTHPSTKLLFIGDGPERARLEKRCRKHDFEGVVFTGAVPHDQVPKFLAASDVLVAPYLPHDKFYFSPLKVVEYLAAGRPVLASDVGEISEWVDSSCGRLVEAGEEKRLAEAMVELAGNRGLRIRLAESARARTKRDDWSGHGKKILERADTLRGVLPERPVDRVGYILKMFPRFSETFVLREVLELEKAGVDICTFSMKEPTGPRQADVHRVRGRQRVLPDPKRFPSVSVWMAHLDCLIHWPRGYVEALRFAQTRGDRKALEKFLQAGVIARAARRERIGHFHAHFASGPTRVAKLASMISGVPFSFTAHAKDLYWKGHRHGSSKKLKKRVQRARFVSVISEENKRFIENQGFEVKPGRVRPIYIGIPIDDYPFTLPSRRSLPDIPLILAVGRLIEKKGFDVLLEAGALLQEHGVSFRIAIAGDGPEEDTLRQRAHALGIADQVELLGAIPLRRLRQEFYAQASVLAQPCVIAADGDQDGIPTVLVEAMALGVPVISTRVSGIPEAIDNGETGFLTDPGDAATLALRVATLLTDLELADRLSRGARLRVEEQFDLRRNVGKLHKLFRRSLAGWPSREEWLAVQKLDQAIPETRPTSLAPASPAGTVRLFAPSTFGKISDPEQFEEVGTSVENA